jgi:hypothetical protein
MLKALETKSNSKNLLLGLRSFQLDLDTFSVALGLASLRRSRTKSGSKVQDGFTLHCEYARKLAEDANIALQRPLRFVLKCQDAID